MHNDKVLLSVRNLEVKFHVRGRELTAIRNISFDLYENESIAIVGESGSGKSVLTKAFAGMLDENGFISHGDIIFNDEELADTSVALDGRRRNHLEYIEKKLNGYAKYEQAAPVYAEILNLTEERKRMYALTDEEKQSIEDKIDELEFKKAEEFNLKLTIDPSKEKERYKESKAKIAAYAAEIKKLKKKNREILSERKKQVDADTEAAEKYREDLKTLKAEYDAIMHTAVLNTETESRNSVLAREIYLSVGRYDFTNRVKFTNALLKAVKKAMLLGADLDNEEQRNKVFDEVVFRVKYLDETEDTLRGVCVLNLAKIKYSKDWTKIRGGKIATIFQDPMTSLNPVITIGKQISSVIIKHQKCSEIEARARALELMKKVGIPNAELRYDDYPFQYSGGMRQRIVIAIALSCQPKILICDEPTTALDVTIQAQILDLLKHLQKEFNYTIVFITHDLGVVANIAERVVVLYAGQIAEIGTAEDIFYDPRHPYTWALLSSLPQLAQRNTELYSISGTPPSLYNKIVGDAFAPRNPYCLRIDTLKEPPMFKISDTHYAKTWLLDPRAPKTEKPEAIRDIHAKLMRAFNL